MTLLKKIFINQFLNLGFVAKVIPNVPKRNAPAAPDEIPAICAGFKPSDSLISVFFIVTPSYSKTYDFLDIIKSVKSYIDC